MYPENSNSATEGEATSPHLAVAEPSAPGPAPIPTQASDPGKALAIVGIVLGFLFMSLIGLILSIIGRKKSTKAGYSGTAGLLGIIINSILLVLQTLTILAIMLAAYNGVQQKVREQSQQSLKIPTTENIRLA